MLRRLAVLSLHLQHNWGCICALQLLFPKSDPKLTFHFHLMAGNLTFSIIKPDAFGAGLSGAILADLQAAGFALRGLRLLHLSTREAEGFYEVHRERPFFNDLVSFMTSGPCIVLALQKDNAVADFRTLIGATNPEQAAEGTIRKKYATNIEKNAIHGSDSDENALREIHYFFSDTQLV
jgi:nucleoside-diphosphate kinase